MKSARSGARGVLSISLVDSAVGSLGNFVLSVAVARSSSRSEFGAYTAAFALYLVALGLSRALASETLLVRLPEFSAQQESVGLAIRQSVGTALTVGPLFGALLIGLGLLVGRHHLVPFVIFGTAMPFLLVQDAWRYVGFALREPRTALLNDAVWTGGTVAGCSVLIGVGHLSGVGAMTVWVTSAAVAAALGAAQLRTLPAPSGCAAWLRANRALGARFAAEAALSSGSTQSSLYLVGAVAGLSALGAVSGATTLLGPASTMLIGASSFLVPWLVWHAHAGEIDLRRRAVAAAGLMSLTVVAWSIVLAVIPARAGRTVLGPTWTPAHSLLLPATVWLVGSSALVATFAAFRAQRRAVLTLRLRMLSGPTVLIGAIVGAALYGAHGAMWGLAIAQVSAAAMQWTVLLLRPTGPPTAAEPLISAPRRGS
jgi:O-antigen/teichoic acid export membrane protein